MAHGCATINLVNKQQVKTMIPSKDKTRIEKAVQDAADSFWSVIVDHFPEASTGDFDMNSDDTMAEWVQRWVHLNADPQETEDMTDQIVYLVVTHGVDGRESETIAFASFNESECDTWYDDNPNRNYYSKTKRIVEVGKEHRKIMRKLDGIERLMLELDQRTAKK